MIKGGYYIKARKTQESEIAHASPCTREIWDWFLLQANHQSHKKDSQVLERGQLMCRYEDILNALHWRVGWRKMRYSKWECERALKALKKATMIATKKTTRGMIVTVLNYDHYQNPANYEGQIDKQAKKATVEPQTTDTIDKNVKNERKKKKKFVPPKIEEVIKYIQENPELSNIDPQDFWKGYSDGGWIDTQGKPVRNWKLKLRTRSKFEAERNPPKICYLCGKPAKRYRAGEGGKKLYICDEHLPREAPKREPPKRKDEELVTRDKAQEQISKLAEKMGTG